MKRFFSLARFAKIRRMFYLLLL